MPSRFGDQLRNLRRELKLSQHAMAGALSSTQRHISFLETGRSAPSRDMVSRMVTELHLNAGQRANLYAASDFAGPFKHRDLGSAEVVKTLDMIETQILRHWPFAAMVLDADWNILRLNKPARMMFSASSNSGNDRLNMFEFLLSDTFFNQVRNWDEVAPSVYFRLQSNLARSAQLRKYFEQARATGKFDRIPELISSGREVPVVVPLELEISEGCVVQLTSLLGRLVAAQDALVEGFEVEFFVPVNEESETLLRQILM